MTEQPHDIRLVIEIQNKKPIELLDLTKSFISIANQFNDYAAQHGDSKENREAKLYVKEIKTGSVTMELIEIATIGMIPFMENMNTIFGFAEYVKKAVNYVLGNADKPKELSQTDYKDLSQILNPIAKDNGSQLNVSTKVDGNLELHLHLNSLEANAAINLISENIKQLKAPDESDGIKTKVLLTLFQTRSDTKAKTGNKGIIEDISPNPMNIIFEDEELNEKMLHGEFNPNDTVYVVDVLPQKVNGKIASYKILKLHDTFEKPE